MPQIPTNFPELQSMSESELEHLLNDEHALKRFVMTNGEINGFQTSLKEIQADNMGEVERIIRVVSI